MERPYKFNEEDVQLRTLSYSESVPPFKDQQQYSLEAVKAAVAENKQLTFYIEEHGHRRFNEVEDDTCDSTLVDIKQVCKDLDEAKIPFHKTYGNEPYLVQGVYINLKWTPNPNKTKADDNNRRGPRLHVRQVDDDAVLLDSWTRRFVETTGKHLVYHGESRASVCAKAFDALGVSKRMAMS